MEIILLQDIEKLGARGEIVKVADGYARNFLLPQKHALAATPQNRKWLEQQRVRFTKEEARERAGAAGGAGASRRSSANRRPTNPSGPSVATCTTSGAKRSR